MLRVFLSVALSVPLPQIPAGTWHYQSRMTVEGKTISTVPVKLDIVEERGRWVVTETTSMPSGEVIESVEMDRDTWAPRKHSIMQGAMRLVATFEGGKLTGSATIGAETKLLEAQIETGVLPGGPAVAVLMSAGLLDKTNALTFRYFDIKTLTAVARVAHVVRESVKVPAGDFMTSKFVFATPGTGVVRQTVWVAVTDRRIVKTATTIPEAKAVVINELLK